MADEKKIWNVIILGTGPAGLTAALYTARANLSPLILHGNQPGGQLTTTTEIENFPGFIKGIDGNELIDNMTKQSERFGAIFEYGVIQEIDTTKRPFVLKSSTKTYYARSVIVSTGAKPKKLGLPSEDVYWSKGVTSCATCDGYFYKGQEVCVIGGGDSAMEEATFLTRMCKKVYLIHRRDKFRSSAVMTDRALKNEKIQVIYNSAVEEIVGNEKGVTGVKLIDTVKGTKSQLDIKGVFLAIGHIPNTEILKGKVNLDDQGYATTEPKSTKTNIEGLFACGDCQDSVYRQAVTAAGTGCMAAIEAERWLETQHF